MSCEATKAEAAFGGCGSTHHRLLHGLGFLIFFLPLFVLSYASSASPICRIILSVLYTH